jgi:trk system potassium uptake protein TrkA
MVTLLLKDLGVKYIVAKAQNELHSNVLYKIGADRVVLPERDLGIRVAHNIASSNVLDYIELSPDYSILEISAIPEWEDKTLVELSMRAKYGINVMAIKRGKDINVSPTAADLILKGDILVVIAGSEELNRIEKLKR